MAIRRLSGFFCYGKVPFTGDSRNETHFLLMVFLVFIPDGKKEIESLCFLTMTFRIQKFSKNPLKIY